MDNNNKLFDLNKYGKEIERPLNIVYNDKRVDINVKELFDTPTFVYSVIIHFQVFTTIIQLLTSEGKTG
jgi:hypothetical protein